MVNAELTFNGVISLNRFMLALKYLNSSLLQDDIWYLAEKSRCGSIEEEGEVKTKCIAF